MGEIGARFRTWLSERRIEGVAPQALDDSRYRFALAGATAEVNLYPYGDDDEIVELRVLRASDGDTTFFLHFELADDLSHAEALFSQMEEALAEEGGRRVTHVLLACTSALTTTLFAARMNEVAEALGLGYAFEAMSVDRAVAAQGDYAAIMLAPQAAYHRADMVSAHPEALVFEIPGKVYGAYDAPGAIRLLMHALREVEVPGDMATPIKAVRDLTDDRRVLVVTLFVINDSSRLGYRLYDRGKPGVEGALRKRGFDYADIGDLIQLLSVGEVDPSTLDAIAIAVPGVAQHGVVHLPIQGIKSFDLGMALEERFGVPVYVDNNCNAAAVGCYVSQDKVESLVFYRHAFGHPAGGIGTVIDGRILKGRLNLAGEPQYFGHLFTYDKPLAEGCWTADGLHQMARCVSLAIVSLIAPDALYLAVDTVDDADEFAATLAGELGEEYVPPIRLVNDYVERVYLGTLALALRRLRMRRAGGPAI